MNELKKEIEENKDVYIAVLKDVMNDLKKERAFLKKIVAFLCILVFVLFAGILSLSAYNQNLLKEFSEKNQDKVFNFMQDFNTDSVVELITENSSENYGNLTVKR
jgi:hypothetical protein